MHPRNEKPRESMSKVNCEERVEWLVLRMRVKNSIKANSIIVNLS